MNDLCKLTRTRGTFVKSHLLPRALTRPSKPGNPFIEHGEGRRPVKRWDSWFDYGLVTREGEDILAEIDDAGITELRRHRLVWSGRTAGGADPLPDSFDETSGVGIRIVAGVDVHSLALFFLSLLWRCAASKRPEMSDISIPIDRLERLRCMLVRRSHNPLAAYPFMLTQLTQVGEAHNHAPTAITMPPATLHGESSRPVPVFRFYLDGLIANFIRKPSRKTPPFPFDEKSRRMVVMTQTTDKSFQIQNLHKAILDANHTWPNVMSRLVRP